MAVFISLAKAFDTVNHKVLLRKMEIYGILFMYGLHLSFFYKFMCMPLESLKYLLNLVGPIISKEYTIFQNAIPTTLLDIALSGI